MELKWDMSVCPEAEVIVHDFEREIREAALVNDELRVRFLRGHLDTPSWKIESVRQLKQKARYRNTTLHVK